MVRTAVAIVAGFVLTIVLTYAAAVVFILAVFGLPLGSQPRDPTPAEHGVMLALAAAAAVVGGWAAMRIAPTSRGVVAPALAVALAGFMVWGFAGSPGWPAWWGPAIAVAMAGGTWIGTAAAARNRA